MRTPRDIDAECTAAREVEHWLDIRKQAAGTIDPDTAEIIWSYEQTLDPYGVDPNLPEEYRCIGREHFARSPGSAVWVWFGDFPCEVRERLWRRADAEDGRDFELPM